MGTTKTKIKIKPENNVSHIYECMRDYQRKGAHFARRAGSALIADEPGLGKTIQSLGTIVADTAARKIERQQWHLILCPKVAVRNVWEPEIHRWLKDQSYEVLSLVGSLADRERKLREFHPTAAHVFVIINIESLRVKPSTGEFQRSRRDVIRSHKKTKEGLQRVWAPENAVLPILFRQSWDTMICDESQRALIRTSGDPSQTRAGFVLLGNRARRRIALSGTPMRGKPEQLWGTLNWLRPDLYRSYWNWVKLYFVLENDGFSAYNLAGMKPGAKQRLAEDLKDIMLRRTKQEVAPELPPKTYVGAYLDPNDETSPLGIWLEMSPEQRKQYDRVMVEGLWVDGEMVNGALADYTRRRQLAGCVFDTEGRPTANSPKFDWLCEWLEENEGEKLVVVSQYTSTLKAFQMALKMKGYGVGLIVGGMPDSRRDAVVNDFQNGDLQVVFLNTKAGGVALTLDVADNLVFLDETTVPDDQIQAEDRIHRVSRMHNVTIYYLRTLETIEEEVAWVASARGDVQRYLLDGARGVEYARKLFLASRNKKEVEA